MPVKTSQAVDTAANTATPSTAATTSTSALATDKMTTAVAPTAPVNSGNSSGERTSSNTEGSGGGRAAGGSGVSTLEESTSSVPSNTTTATSTNGNNRRGRISSSRMPPGEATSAVSSVAVVEEPTEPLLSSESPGGQAQARALVPLNTTLANARTTPRLAGLLLPLLIVATHAVFYYGQTAPMWKLRLFAHIDVWANATDFQAKTTFNTLGLDRELHFGYDKDDDVETFTYWFAIQQLWKAQGMPGKFLPRLAAAGLVIFSGIWPHLKLFLLQLTWFFGKNQMRRTRLLRWLSTLGKWSLADILSICILVGVLHLDWDVDPGAIKHGIIASLPDILVMTRSLYDNDELCDYLLKMECATQKNLVKITKCKACQNLLSEAYTHPEWAKSTGRSILRGVDTSGGGLATLRVEGMKGIYAFCGAVIFSILWSVIVDIFDHKARQDQAKAMQYNQRITASSTTEPRRDTAIPSSSNPFDDEASDILQEPLLSNHLELEVETSFEEETERLGRQQALRRRGGNGSTGGLFSLSYFIAAVAAAYVVLLAVDLPSMKRQVNGAAPMLLHDILGVNWERSYSLQSLMWTTGGAGGWDLLLMGTFSLFCVIGPILRSILCILVALLDKSSILRRTMVEPVSLLINFLGAFCAWEVIVIAVLMVQMLMPSITNTIIRKPFCAQISDSGSCLEVEFNVLTNAFVWIVVGGFFLLGASFAAVQQGVTPAGDTADTAASGRGQYTLVNNSIDPRFNDGGLEEVVFERQQV